VVFVLHSFSTVPSNRGWRELPSWHLKGECCAIFLKGKIISICLDGASVNFGSDNGIAKQLFNDPGEAVYCLAHNVNRIASNSYQNTASGLPETMITKCHRVMVGLHKEFNQSNVANLKFAEVQKAYNTGL